MRDDLSKPNWLVNDPVPRIIVLYSHSVETLSLTKVLSAQRLASVAMVETMLRVRDPLLFDLGIRDGKKSGFGIRYKHPGSFFR